ncbi:MULTISPECIES: SPOR domain-containing protein [unclassified Paracoccus (in: a-proteobacteria)]|uniref:SPOR domain-containing protein n=1 Tax=unclassified Paracoccus (in: a-proteobacteria) TaxID=2688777 RepID=UPI0021E12757|nr:MULTISPECIES: SPOR domain-containing protein [unclassified Paracoccus (in: a-proteobacteria)]UXU76351.1 SPOR domain-containing protein [Paracoccus sp. SMMA_5]UXU82311.1 SPOR domain-containing protein [Paracoccus sp. SMMA_5_TC]
MTVVDFRSSGGFDGAQPQRRAREYTHGHAPQDHHDDWQHDAWDRHALDDQAEALIDSPSLLGRLSRLTHYLGALISVGLMVVLAVWGFKLVVRDVSGVPVIRAIEGEARTAPDNPGGELSDHTGLAVNVVAAGDRPGRADTVAIAPPATGLDAQDVPMGELGATAQPAANPVELPVLDEPARVIARPDSEAAKVTEALVSDAPAAEDAVNEVVTDLSGNETRDVAISAALAEAVAAPTAVPAGGVAESPRPAPRPRRVATAANAPAPAANPAAQAQAPEAPVQPPPAAAQVAPGAPMVQIGAFDSDALARGEWDRVSGKFGALFAGKARVVQEAQSGGRTFWRLRAAGFASKDDARRFCAALIAEGVDCIPATAK